MKISTVLLSGAGNTFHIINDIDSKISSKLNSNKISTVDLAIQICKKNSADGVIFLQKEINTTDTFKWIFYNNDGSVAEMCGNATRCVGFFIKHVLKEPHKEWRLNTKAGLITIEALQDRESAKDLYRVKMTKIEELYSKHGFYCNTGVPHLVLEIDDMNKHKSLTAAAKSIRNHADFAPAGTNVTYVQRLGETNKLKAVSFERGVEGFTAACGTGAMAAAFYNLKMQKCEKTFIEMPGGTLMMDVTNLTEPIMVGPAIMLGNFEYEI